MPASKPRASRRLSAGQRLDLLLQAVSGAAAPPAGRAAAPRRGRNVFKAAEVSRLYSWSMGPLHPDQELRGDLRLMRQRGRRFERDNAWVRRYLGLQATNILGPENIRVEPTVRDRQGELDERVNGILRASWKAWCEGPVSADGSLDYLGLSMLALKSVPRDGEAFSRDVVDLEINPFGYALELVDPDLVDETHNEVHGNGLETRLGIQVDRRGRRVGYWVSRDVRSGMMGAPADLVPGSEMFHHYLPLRANQMRGVTWLAPVMATLDMLAGYGEAELVASRLAAAKQGFIIQNPDSAPGEVGLDEEGSEAGATSGEAAGSTLASGDLTLEQLAQIAMPQNLLDGSPGSITELGLGKSFSSWDPQHPTTAFPDATKMWLREAASGMEISYAALTGDVSQGSFSSERVERQREQERYQILQAWWIASWSRRVYRAWLRTAILTEALPLPSRDWRLYQAHELVPREWGYVKPLEDAETAQLQLGMGITSRSRLTRGQFPKILEELAKEAKAARTAQVVIDGSASAPKSPAPPKPNPDEGAPDSAESDEPSPAAE